MYIEREEVQLKNVYTVDSFESEISDQLLTLTSSSGKTLLLAEDLISSVLECIEGHAVRRHAHCSALLCPYCDVKR